MEVTVAGAAVAVVVFGPLALVAWALRDVYRWRRDSIEDKKRYNLRVMKAYEVACARAEEDGEPMPPPPVREW